MKKKHTFEDSIKEIKDLREFDEEQLRIAEMNPLARHLFDEQPDWNPDYAEKIAVDVMEFLQSAEGIKYIRKELP